MSLVAFLAGEPVEAAGAAVALTALGSESPSAVAARTWAGVPAASAGAPACRRVPHCRRDSSRSATSPGGSMPSKTPEKKSEKKATKAQPKAGGGGKANALQQALQPSEELAAVVGGPAPLPRGEVVSKVWDYIKANNLQNPENRREILADDKLRKVFGKDKVTMFEMNKHLAQHLK
jgi:chromatin remodeling complex protein RSC6